MKISSIYYTMKNEISLVVRKKFIKYMNGQ